MGVFYTLELDTDATQPELVRLCRGDEPILKEERVQSGNINVSMPLLFCSVGLVRNARSRDIAMESFGLAPTANIMFDIDKRDHDGSESTMKRAVLRLLRGTQGDAILSNNGEHAVLRRVGDRGIINEKWSPSFGDLLDDLGPTWTIAPDPGPVP